jgi:Skp family chaperone for outer membrane proteins
MVSDGDRKGDAMKTMVLCVALAGCAALTAAAELRVAVVNGSRVLKEYYRTELADAHIQQQLDDFAAERDKLLAEHKKLKQEFEGLKAETLNKALTEEAREKKREQAEDKLAEVIEYENTIRDKAATRKKQIESEGRKIQAELARAVKDAVKACAVKGGYTLVLEGGGLLANGLEPVLYSEPKMDITGDVLKLLNADKPAGKE